jgi:hypothetical protein
VHACLQKKISHPARAAIRAATRTRPVRSPSSSRRSIHPVDCPSRGWTVPCMRPNSLRQTRKHGQPSCAITHDPTLPALLPPSVRRRHTPAVPLPLPSPSYHSCLALHYFASVFNLPRFIHPCNDPQVQLAARLSSNFEPPTLITIHSQHEPSNAYSYIAHIHTHLDICLRYSQIIVRAEYTPRTINPTHSPHSPSTAH